MSKKLWIGLVGAAVVVSVAVGLFTRRVAVPVATPMPTITIGYRNHDLYAPLFVGMEQKIFEKHNVAVKAVPFASTNQITDALLAHTIDAALGGVNTPLLMSIEDKSPGELKLFTLVKETQAVPVSFLLVPKNSTATSLGDLKNKKIGLYPGSTAKLVYRKMLDHAGLSAADITTVELKPELELPALQAGQVDAVIVLQPLATIATEKGVASIIDQGLFAKYFMPDVPVAGSVVSGKFVRENPEAVKNLVAATDEAIQFINSHHAETATISAHYTGLEVSLINKTLISRFYTLAEIQPADLQKLSDFLLIEHELKKSVDVASMLLSF